ncbi:MAG: FAD-dependent oxidoreductase [Thermodesulfobacteriota bacterium]
MKAKDDEAARRERLLPQGARKQLKEIFDTLPREVPLYLFTSAGDRTPEIRTGRDLLAAFSELTDKIKVKELDLGHPRAKEWDVSRSPTLVFAPERYKIKYLGVPLGEEGRTLVETLVLLGLGRSNLGDQSKKVLARLESPRAIRVFVSPTCPYCPQQAVNAVKAAVERPDLVSVEIVDTSFNSDLAELYSAYSVPQTWANDVRIAEGAQAEELFAASLEKMEQQTYFIPESDAALVETDLVIVGGGPAGLTAGIYAARSGLKTVIIERAELGGQVAATPVVENYPGLTRIGGQNLVDIMVAHALQYVKIFRREAVMEVAPGEPFEITTTLRRFTARAVLLATGASHRRLGASGEARLAGRGVSYCATCDGPLFQGRSVAVVGGGDSAVTEALHLDHLGVKVSLLHRRDKLRAQEHLVRELEHHRIPILWNTEVKEVKGREKVGELVLADTRTGETSTLKVDGVFVSIGYNPEVELARKLGVALTEEGYLRHDGRHRTNVRGVYCAGDVAGGYKQIVIAAGAGAAAAMTIFEDLTHPYWKDEGRHQVAGG